MTPLPSPLPPIQRVVLTVALRSRGAQFSGGQWRVGGGIFFWLPRTFLQAGGYSACNFFSGGDNVRLQKSCIFKDLKARAEWMAI